MPYKEPDPSDPNMLVGVELPATADTTEEMAYVFAEEFARMGFDKAKIIKLFSRPFYAGSHRAYQELGAEKIKKIVEECLEILGRSTRKTPNSVEKGDNHAKGI